MKHSWASLVAAFAPVAFALSGCSGASPSALRALGETGAGKITHVVYIVQENRSFDDMFQGYPGADTRSYGYDSNGVKIKLRATSLRRVYLLDHSAEAMFSDCDGSGKLPGTKCRMDGFNNEIHYGGPANPMYVYVPHNESKPYWDMAKEWVLADTMF